jgi:two-component system nitrate/nitrite response regulator NarL
VTEDASGGSSAESVLVAHSSPLLRDGIAAALLDDGLTDVRVSADLGDAHRQLRERPCAVTLAGLELCEGNAGRLVAELLEVGSGAVIVLAPLVREPELLAALEAGALGYVSRAAPLHRLVYDVRGALRGEACLPRDMLAPVLRLLIDRRRAEDERSQRLDRLSRREREVLVHMVHGAGNDEIATALFLSQATVRTHVQNILGKLEVHSRLEAISFAHDAGLTS